MFAINRTGLYPVTGASIALEISLLRHSVTHLVDRTGDPHRPTNAENSRAIKTHIHSSNTIQARYHNCGGYCDGPHAPSCWQ